MFHITTPAASNILRGLLGAAQRSGCSWGMFLTNDAVTLVHEPTLQPMLKSSEKVVVCESSWDTFAPKQRCPVEKGSQTSNSEMISFAKRVISL